MRTLHTLATALLLSLTTVATVAQTSSSRSTLERSLRTYFENYKTGRAGNTVSATLSSLQVDDNNRTIRVTANDKFRDQEFTPEVVSNIYKSVKSLLPSNYQHYALQVRTHGMPIEELVPNRLRNGNIDHSRQWRHIDYEGKPWVTNVSRPNEISRGLDGRHLTIAASHGKYFEQKTGRWKWQRPNLFCTTEDLFTQTIVIPFLMPMLENAGAIVWSPRERDWQKNEVIIDNDGRYPANYYNERNGSHPWGTTPRPGYARHAGTYTNGENPFQAGTCRVAESTTGKNVSV